MVNKIQNHLQLSVNAQKPSRAYVAGVYAKRIVRWNRTSSPYLSGDAFAESADFVYDPPRFRRSRSDLRDLRNAKVIFCESHKLKGFLGEFESAINARIILAGNSDFEFHETNFCQPKSVGSFFLQNSFVSDNEKFYTLPIGIENFRFGVNGNPRNLKAINLAPREKKILFGPFSDTHGIRKDIEDIFSSTPGPWFVQSERVSPKEFNRLSQKYDFVAAVRGNGVDTHRLWESCYRGLVPIILRDSWSSSLKHLKLPIGVVDSWDPKDLNSLLRMEVQNRRKPIELEALWMPFWIKRFEELSRGRI